MDDSTFENSVKFIVENRNELEQYYLNGTFWNRAVWLSKKDDELWITTYGFERLCECPCFYKYFMRKKQNALSRINVPFCENVFDNFVNFYFNRKHLKGKSFRHHAFFN